MADYTGGKLLDPGSDSLLIGDRGGFGILLVRLAAAPNDPDYDPPTPVKTTGQLWPRGDW